MPKKQVMIVDYGAGNVRSVGKAVEKLGYAAKLSDDPDDISNAKAIIFPVLSIIFESGKWKLL